MSASALARTVLAPAKINLWLHVVGRRADGHHLLDSLVAFADVGDTLAAAPDPVLSLAIDGPFAARLSAGEDNLVLRAARALAEECGARAGARLHLTKRLPVASGIGGGSADAAAALRALVHLWRVAIAPERLASLALGLGADVPVCLAGRPALVGGIGETVVPVPALPAVALLLVNPGVPLGTAAVFRARAQGGAGFGPAAPGWTAPRDAAELAGRLAATRNDLEAAARSLVPDIGDVLQAIAGAPGCLLARMSGSGATCFGIFGALADARHAAASLAAAHPGWWTAPALLRDAQAPDAVAGAD